jgi:hypothetical protein
MQFLTTNIFERNNLKAKGLEYFNIRRDMRGICKELAGVLNGNFQIFPGL